jgi:hypothetical protein
MTSRGSTRTDVPGAGVVHPSTQPGAVCPSRRGGVVVTGAVEPVVGAAIEVVEPLVVGGSAVDEVVGAAPSSPSEPLLLQPVATRAPATTIAVTTRLSCCPTAFAMPKQTLNHRAGLTPPAGIGRPASYADPTRGRHQPAAASRAAWPHERSPRGPGPGSAGVLVPASRAGCTGRRPRRGNP